MLTVPNGCLIFTVYIWWARLAGLQTNHSDEGKLVLQTPKSTQTEPLIPFFKARQKRTWLTTLALLAEWNHMLAVDHVSPCERKALAGVEGSTNLNIQPEGGEKRAGVEAIFTDPECLRRPL